MSGLPLQPPSTLKPVSHYLKVAVEQVDEPEFNCKSELGGTQAMLRVRKLVLSASVLETLLILITIGLGFNVENEVSRSIVAVVTHVLFSIVTTGFVFWNKSPPTHHTILNAVKFWICNVLFLTKPLSFRRNEMDQNWELCDLEAKLKASYTRLLVSFFTIIPACFVQNYFLFQTGDKVFEQTRAVDVLRIVTIATGLFNTAKCVYEYDELTIEYELKSKIEATSSLVEFRTGFWRYLNYICQRVTLTGYLASISPYFALIYTISNFTSNYVVLKGMPQLENPYVNAPYGVHNTASFWTFRIINVISGIGTRLNLDLIYKYYYALLRLSYPSTTVWIIFTFHSLQLIFLVLHTYNLAFSFSNPIIFVTISCVYFVSAWGDNFIDILSFPCGGSIFILHYKEHIESMIIEPIWESRLCEKIREWSTWA